MTSAPVSSSATPMLACGAADSCFEWQGPSGTLVLRVYEGTAGRSPALLVFFPPGGFLDADLDASDACYKTVAVACGATLLAPSYAVAPEHPFPAAVEDTHAVLSHLAKQGSKVPGWTGKYLFIGGVEAGGNLAAVAAHVCRDRLGPKLAGQVLMMPMLDPSMTDSAQGTPREVQSITDAYRRYLPRLSDRVHPYACPLASSRLAGLPPALLVHAKGDALEAESKAYADKLEAAGVPVQRVALEPGVMEDVDGRCAAAADDPCVMAVAAFIRPFVSGALAKPSTRAAHEPAAVPSKTSRRTTS